MKQKAQRFPQAEQEATTGKRQRIDERPQQTRKQTRANPNDTNRIEKGRSTVMTPREALGLPKLPSVVHELVAILQFVTSYEFVEWLAHRLQCRSVFCTLREKHRVPDLINMKKIWEYILHA